MSRILDTETKSVKVECPECKHEFEQDVEITIYEPSIDVDVEAR